MGPLLSGIIVQKYTFQNSTAYIGFVFIGYSFIFLVHNIIVKALTKPEDEISDFSPEDDEV